MLKKRRKQYQTHRTLKSVRSQKIRQRPRRDLVGRTSKKFKKKIQTIVITTVTLLILVVSVVLRQIFFYGSNQRIAEVAFTQASLAAVSNPTLFDDIEATLQQGHWRAMRWFGTRDQLTMLQEDYPYIQDIRLVGFESGLMTTDIIWHQPQIVYRMPGERWYASYQEHLFGIQPEDTLIDQAWIVDLPRYTETFDSLDGIYRQFSETQLIEVLSLLDEALDSLLISERIYLPGGRKLFLGYDSRRWYFHLNKDLIPQIEKLIAVQSNYTEYDSISIIDLGSTDNVIVQ